MKCTWIYRIWTGRRGEEATALVNDRMARLIFNELNKRGTIIRDNYDIKSYFVGDDYHELIAFSKKVGE